MTTIIWAIIGIIIVGLVVYYLIKGKGKSKKQTPPTTGQGESGV